MKITVGGKEFETKNQDKMNRVIEGTQGPKGQLQGGLGADAPDELKLAHYDKLGGLVTYEGQRVKTGSFWDFAAKKPHDTPNPKLIMRVNGKDVEFAPDAPKPLEVQAAQAGEAQTDFTKMTPKALKAYAEENGIDLGEATTKPQMVKAIREAEGAGEQ